MSLRLESFRAPLPRHRPYVLEAEQGTTLAIVGSGSVVRYLSTGEETGDAFAVVQSRGRSDEVVPAQCDVCRLQVADSGADSRPPASTKSRMMSSSSLRELLNFTVETKSASSRLETLPACRL